MNTLRAQDTGIAARIYQSFPSGTYCLPALLRVLEVVETTKVETAAIECRAVPRLLVNPEFVALHADTPEKLLVLVLHELHHLLLGHTRLYLRPTPLDNLAFDAVINATLARLLPEPEYLAMFTDFYDEAQLIPCFLRPATGWSPGGKPVCPPALVGDDPELQRLRQVHEALYSEVGVTYDEMRDAIGRAFWFGKAAGADGQAFEELPPLLGDHSDEGAMQSSSSGALEQRAPALVAAVRDIVERWPPPPSPIVGRSVSEFLKDRRVAPMRPSPPERLRRLIRAIAGTGGGTGAPRDSFTTVASMGAVPRLSRRGVVLRALGATPLLHENPIPLRRRLPDGERVHVYLDVSGSLHELVPTLYGAILSCRDLVHPVVHTFSTAVADLTLGELRRGKVRTTGGTDITCVAEHVRENRIRRAVVVTDGYVGTPNQSARAALNRVRVGVALTPGGQTRSDLEGVVDIWTSLEP